MMNIRNFKNWDAEDILDLLGLETKRDYTDYLLPAVGIFALGVVVGAGIGMLFAPKEGKLLRQDLSNRVSSGYQAAKERISEVPSKLGVSSEIRGSTAGTTGTGAGATARSATGRNTSV